MIAETSPVLQLAQGATRAFAWLLSISIILSAVIVAFGVILIIISFLKGGFKDEGKDWIKSGITGLLITVLAWLILNTINPGIFSFNLSQLPEILSRNTPFTGININSQPKIANYQEIPIGTASEKLLTQKINCYDFDAYGDPIAGPLITTDNGQKILGPTYLNHDRVDCYLKLADAAEKKSLVIENLSKEIINLMNQCSCQGRCEDPCNKNNDGCMNSPVGQDCSNNACAKLPGAACEIPKSLQNSLLKQNKDTSLSCCPENVKNQIRGYITNPGDGKGKVQPIKVKLKIECSSQGGCQDDIGKDYYGLDEFRQGRAGQGLITELIEKKITFQKEEISYIDLDNCPTCLQTCECVPGDQKCQNQQEKCLQNKQQCLLKKQECFKKTAWGNLNLYEQLSYFKEKMKQISYDIENDKKELAKNSEKLSSCVTPKSSVGLIKTDEFLDKNEVFLKINKGAENTSSHCQGFGYAQSQCSQQCSDMCPITKGDVACYESCASSSKCYNKDPIRDPKGYQECIAKNNACLNQCDSNRKCIYNPGFSNFGVCMGNCKQTCSSLCQAKYLPCSDEFQACQAMCNNDSQCLSNNIDTCLVNPYALGQCKNVPDDQVQKCIESAYKCQYGSQQNAGYEDCLKNPNSDIIFTASYLYQNPLKQTCPNIYALNRRTNQSCIEEHPETQKCPMSSECPDCPCGSINQNLKFSYSSIEPPKEVNICEGNPADPETYCETTTKTVKEFRLVGPECQKQAFNGDPLTFYCRGDWWNEPETKREKNLGGKYDKPEKNITCKRSDEIPVGMLVDNSIKWADETTVKIGKISDSIQEMLNFMTKISKEKDYCSCSSRYESGNPVCRACCQYNEGGNPGTAPSCQFVPCSGNACQQMINWLYEVINYHRDVRINFIDLYIDLLSEPRTDILKMLTSARNQTDSCSTLENQKGEENNILLSCQQILDNIVYPVTDPNNKISIDQKEIYHYCYGLLSGKLLNASAQNDNWFCCKTTSQVDIEEQRQENEKQKKLYYNLAE